MTYLNDFYLFCGCKFSFPGALPALGKSSFLRLLVGIGIKKKRKLYIQTVLNKLAETDFATTYEYFFIRFLLLTYNYFLLL